MNIFSKFTETSGKFYDCFFQRIRENRDKLNNPFAVFYS